MSNKLNINKKELSLLIDSFSHVENLSKDDVKHALEEALATGIRKSFDKDTVVVVDINEQYEAYIYRKFEVVSDEEVNFLPSRHIYEDIAQEKYNPKLKIGDFHLLPIDNFDFKRMGATIVKQLLKTKIKEIHFKNLKNSLMKVKDSLVNITVKHFDLTNQKYIVEYNFDIAGELPFSNLLNSNEKLKVGHSYLAMFDNLDKDEAKPIIKFTRKSDQFIKNVIRKEIPEIDSEEIQIKYFARIDGNKTVVFVHANDKKVEPVGYCIGSKGIRIQNISKQLGGEKIEFYKWDEEITNNIQSVLGNVQLLKVVFENDRIRLGVDSESIKKASYLKNSEHILTQLFNKKVEIRDVNLLDEVLTKDNEFYLNHLCEALNLDEDSADVLMSSGYSTVDDILVDGVDGLVETGFELSDSQALFNTANTYVLNRKQIISLSETDLTTLNINDFMIDYLFKANIRTTDDLSELNVQELQDIIPVSSTEAQEFIFAARGL